jgi:uncharacterized protein (TIGR03083 family)
MLSGGVLPIVDTRPFFRPAIQEILSRLRGLPPDAWDRPTLARAWRVRDVVAHLSDTALRRLSAQRDGNLPPGRVITDDRDLVVLINDLNAEWVRVAKRFSPRVLIDLYALAGGALADFMETLSLEGEAFFPVSWSRDARTAAWLDIGREFTEVWHHGSQIGEAVGAGRLSDPAWLHAVLALALHALPRAYAEVPALPDRSLVFEISGPAGGVWTLRSRDGQWDIGRGSEAEESARAIITDESAWRLFFNALSPSEAERAVRIIGDASLARPLLRTRSVIV